MIINNKNFSINELASWLTCIISDLRHLITSCHETDWLPVNYRQINIFPNVSCLHVYCLRVISALCGVRTCCRSSHLKGKDSGLMLPTSASVWRFGSFTAVTVSQCWLVDFWEENAALFSFLSRSHSHFIIVCVQIQFKVYSLFRCAPVAADCRTSYLLSSPAVWGTVSSSEGGAWGETNQSQAFECIKPKQRAEKC